MSMRDEFEKWVISPPYEKSVDKYPESNACSWPGQYRALDVQLAWEAWQAARAQEAEPVAYMFSDEWGCTKIVLGKETAEHWCPPDNAITPLYAQPQTAVPGEEIHVNVEGDDVYMLPLQPSGMESPRFVVHVPAAEKPEPTMPQHPEPFAYYRRHRGHEMLFASDLDAEFVPGDGWTPLYTQPTIPKLEWSRTLFDGKVVTLSEAEEAVAKLGEGWRLPTRQELESLLDLSRHDPAIDTSKYPDAESCAHWTGTPCAWNSDARWVVDFVYGLIDDYDRNDYACVRAVRDVEEGQGDE